MRQPPSPEAVKRSKRSREKAVKRSKRSREKRSKRAREEETSEEDGCFISHPSMSSEEIKRFERRWKKIVKDFCEKNSSPDLDDRREEDVPDIMEIMQKIRKAKETPAYKLRPGLYAEQNWQNKRIEIETDKWKYSSGSFPPNHRSEDFDRYGRVYRALNFSRHYEFVEGRTHCVRPNRSWEGSSGKCYDQTWLAVHGTESVCMVTRAEMKRREWRYPTDEDFLQYFAACIISEVECLPYDLDEYDDRGRDVREMFGCPVIEKPFVVFSVVSDTKKVHGDEALETVRANKCGEAEAVTFLRGKLDSGLALTPDETIQTAIGAFQHLCPGELKAEDIWVSTLLFAKNRLEHLDLDVIDEHLAVLRGDSSCVSASPSWRGRGRPPGSITEFLQLAYHNEPGCRPCNCLTCRLEGEDDPSVVEGSWLPV